MEHILMNLQLSLKREWFEMTKRQIKMEDYREITPYWCSRLLTQNGKKETQKFWQKYIDIYGIEQLANVYRKYDHVHRIRSKIFDKNIMTDGYPKKTDLDKFIYYEHGGIEIREGNTEWGAAPGRLYFVIKHKT